MESTNNRTTLPLGIGKSYLGTWDQVTAFGSATIACFADTQCQITMFSSTNKQLEFPSVFSVSSEQLFTTTVDLPAPYVRFAVRNTGGTSQNTLVFNVIYHQAYAPAAAPLPFPTSIDAHIFGSDGETVGMTDASLNVNVKNSAPISVEAPSTRAYVKAWDAATINSGDVSAALTLDETVSRALTVYGNCNQACVITLQFSPNGSEWYSSASAYTLASGGDFGWCVPGACPSRARLIATGGALVGATITAHIEAC